MIATDNVRKRSARSQQSRRTYQESLRRNKRSGRSGRSAGPAALLLLGHRSHHNKQPETAAGHVLPIFISGRPRRGRCVLSRAAWRAETSVNIERAPVTGYRFSDVGQCLCRPCARGGWAGRLINRRSTTPRVSR